MAETELDEFGNRSPGPFPAIATGDAKLDTLLTDLVALKYSDRTDNRRVELAKAIRTRLRKPPAGDVKALLALLVDDAFDVGELQPTDELPGTPAVKRARSASWNRVFGERYARNGVLTILVQAALQYRECDARLAEVVTKKSLDACELVAEAVAEAEGKVRPGPKLVAALGKYTGDDVVRALLRASESAAFEALAPRVEKWGAAGKDIIDTLGQDIDEMQDIPLDLRWRGVLHGLLAKHRIEALPVLRKMNRHPTDVPAIIKGIERELKKIKPGYEDLPVDDVEDAFVMLAERAEVGDKHALPPLLQLTECSGFLGYEIEDVLFQSIGAAGDASAIEPLIKFIASNEEEGDEALVKAAKSALKKLTKGKPVATSKPAKKPAAKPMKAMKPQPYGKAGSAHVKPRTSIAEERARIEALIENAELAPAVATKLAGAMRGAITIYTKRVADDSLPVSTSRFGGRPDLASPWPRIAKIPMTFIAQLRLEELAPFDVDGLLPKRGLLSFFLHDEMPAGSNAPLMYSKAAVLFFPDASALQRAAIPDGFVTDWPRKPLATASLAFHTTFGLPSDGTREARALGKEAVSLDLPGALELPTPATRNQVLGYDDYQGYDPEPPKGTRSLFRCESDSQADMNFGDSQDIAFRINDDDLAAARFDRVKLWFQTG
jgi:uncharacterized protein YwqG